MGLRANSNADTLASLRNRPRGDLRYRNSAYMPTDYAESIMPKFDEQGFGRVENMLSNATYDPSGMAAFKERALQTGESPWASMMKQKLGQEQSQALGTAGAQARSGAAQGMSDLAMRGGLSRGASERLAGRGMRDLNQMRQDIYGRGASQRLDVGIEDEKQRLAALGALPGLQMEEYRTKLGGASPWMDLAKSRLGFETDIFGQRMAGRGSEQIAQAISGINGIPLPGATHVGQQSRRPNLLR